MNPKISDIITAVCSVFEVERSALFSVTRDNLKIAFARQVCMFLARELTGYSYPRIGACFSRDHTTAMHACKRVRERLGSDPNLPAQLDLCRAHIAAVMQQRELNWAAARAQSLVLEAAE